MTTTLFDLLDQNSLLETVEEYVETHPDWRNERMNEEQLSGRTAFHRAIEKECSMEVLHFLVEKWPQGVAVKDDNRELPLHIAFRNPWLIGGHRREELELLVETYPEALKLSDRRGHYPLL